jgi:Zn-dependent M28 family amino/carboxypeptidase
MYEADKSAPAEITAEQLRRHVDHLAGTIGERNVFRPRALHAAEDYIRETWRDQGYGVTAQEYNVHGVRSANLEITRRGVADPDAIILVGAHYDSVQGSPGANDNGSGVAALLEFSARLAGLEPACTLRLVAFVNEEPPFFLFGQMGSLHYARAARRRGDDIRLMIALETIGFYSDAPGSQSYPPLLRHFFPDRANFIGFVSNFRSRAALRELARAYRATTDFPMQYLATFAAVPGVAWSDHLSFWRSGYRALMVTDTAFYRYRWYHTAQDTPDKLNYGEFARMSNGLFWSLMTLAATRR